MHLGAVVSNDRPFFVICTVILREDGATFNHHDHNGHLDERRLPLARSEGIRRTGQGCEDGYVRGFGRVRFTRPFHLSACEMDFPLC